MFGVFARVDRNGLECLIFQADPGQRGHITTGRPWPAWSHRNGPTVASMCTSQRADHGLGTTQRADRGQHGHITTSRSWPWHSTTGRPWPVAHHGPRPWTRHITTADPAMSKAPRADPGQHGHITTGRPWPGHSTTGRQLNKHRDL